MLKAGAYILLLAMLSGSGPVLQLAKLPKLFEHYNEHSKRNPGLSFADFLSMHYWGPDANDNDDEKDKQLPFKEKIAVSAHHDAAITCFQIHLSIPIVHDQVAYNAIYKEGFTAKHACSLFRPPRII